VARRTVSNGPNGEKWKALLCTYLDELRKTAIEYHINSKTHIKNKSGGQSKNISEYIAVKSDLSKEFQFSKPI